MLFLILLKLFSLLFVLPLVIAWLVIWLNGDKNEN